MLRVGTSSLEGVTGCMRVGGSNDEKGVHDTYNYTRWGFLDMSRGVGATTRKALRVRTVCGAYWTYL